MNRYKLLFSTLVLAFVTQACVVDGVNPNITPQAELIFTITDNNDQPQVGASVYLFPFRTLYEDYLNENPDGDPLITPTVASENVGTTDSEGKVTFAARDLEGNSFASGDTWIHRPNSIYFRVVHEDSGKFLNNDNDVFKVSFDELESGDFIIVETPVVIN